MSYHSHTCLPSDGYGHFFLQWIYSLTNEFCFFQGKTYLIVICYYSGLIREEILNRILCDSKDKHGVLMA